MYTENKTKSIERDEIDPIFKDVLIFSFGQLEIPVQTQVEVSRIPRTMDVLILLKWSNELQRVRAENVFSYFRVHNQVEFKGKNDGLTRAGYHLILGRANLYLAEEDISAKEMTVTIISARKPIKVLRHCQDDVRWETIEAGHYISTNILPVHLIVINELPIEPKNYPLLLFAASKKKFRQFLERIVKEDNTVYIYYAHFIDYELTEEVLKMAGKYSSYRKNLERMAEDIGNDILPFLSVEDRVRGLTPEELARRLTLEDRLIGLTPEERRKLKQLLEEEDKKNQK